MLISTHRNDVTRSRISDEHWELVREEREAAGYDREAYEHSLSLKDVLHSQSTVVHDEDGKKWFVFRLGGVLDSAEKVMEISGLKELPKVTSGENERGNVQLCWVDDEGKKKIEEYMQQKMIL